MLTGALILWGFRMMKVEEIERYNLSGLDLGCIAVGNDLVHLPTFALSKSDEFMQKVFTPEELAYCTQFSEPLCRYASTWAGKEAVYKAIRQVSDETLSFRMIEINRLKPAGRPFVTLPDQFASLVISLSITHDGDYAWAIAFLRKLPAQALK